MDAFTFLMDTDNPHRYEHPSKKRWCKRARAPRPQPHPQRSLMVYIRPPTWMAQPLDLSTDVVATIAEVLMRSEDFRKVRTIKALALVNRLCAAAVASTLDQVRSRLQDNAWEYARAIKAQVLHNRGEGDGSADAPEEVARLHAIHETYMAEVGIPQSRRMALVPFADRTWFHDNVSLLGHLGNACELCNAPMHPRTGPGYCFRDGPIMLVACGVCKHKGCVDLELSYADATGQVLTARIEQEETVANNYARALLSKQAAHLKRMRSKRAARMAPPKLGKRVHRIGVTDELSLFYWNSNHRMASGPWYVELWHTLPEGLPQNRTFGALTGVRNSDAVRQEARDHAKWLRARRVSAAQRRTALAKLMRTHVVERKHVERIVQAGEFEGWVQAIDLCTGARAFEARWMFRWPNHGSREIPSSWREQMYKLLQMDEAALGAAVKRVATVAEVLCHSFCSTTMPVEYWKYRTTQRTVVLELVRNFPPTFLERGASKVNALVDMLLRAGIKLELSTTTNGVKTVITTYTLIGDPFDGRRVEVVSYFSGYTVRRISKAIGYGVDGESLTPEMLRELQMYANRPLCACHENQAVRNQARAVIFALPAAWPRWLFG
jgi:hypothetical protein